MVKGMMVCDMSQKMDKMLIFWWSRKSRRKAMRLKTALWEVGDFIVAAGSWEGFWGIILKRKVRRFQRDLKHKSGIYIILIRWLEAFGDICEGQSSKYGCIKKKLNVIVQNRLKRRNIVDSKSR